MLLQYISLQGQTGDMVVARKLASVSGNIQ